MSQVTTLTILRYEGFRGKLWAFWMMQFAHKYLKEAKGCSFYKLMGSGREGFDPRPDWSTYALLQVWEQEECAELFFKEAAIMERYRERSAEIGVFFLKSLKTHGAWSGAHPFSTHPHRDTGNKKIVVITRATIRKRYL